MKKTFSKIAHLISLAVFLFYSTFPSLALGVSLDENQTLLEEDSQIEIENPEEIKNKVEQNQDNYFTQNIGQVKNQEVEFFSNIFAGIIYVQKDKLTYDIKETTKKIKTEDLEDPETRNQPIKLQKKGHVFNETFINPKENLTPQGVNPLNTEVSFFGGAKEDWQTGNYSFKNIYYGEVWNNIEVSLKANNQNLEKIFKVNPTGNPQDIQFQLEGIDSLSISETGELILETSSGQISMTTPIAFQEQNNQNIEVEVQYQLLDNNSYGFQVGAYNPDLPLIIDPLLAGTSFGSNQYMEILDITTDADGNIYVVGYSENNDFPITTGAYDIVNEGDNSFISKFDSNLTELIASTFLGNDYIQIKNILINSDGNIVVSGEASDSSFPTTAGAYDETHNGSSDGFISILNPSLTDLLYSTFIGGSSSDYLYGLDTDSNGNIFVTGSFRSTNLPTTTGAYLETAQTSSSYYETIISKFSPDLSTLEASTYFGGRSGYRLAINSEDKVYIYGESTNSMITMPPGSYQSVTYDSAYDSFVAKLDNNLTAFEAGTFIGGEGNEWQFGMIIDGSDNIIISGSARDTFPTTSGAYSNTHGGGDLDYYVSILDSSLSNLVASTFLGGSGDEWYFFGIPTYNSLDLDSEGNLFVGGFTTSPDFPTTSGAFQENPINNGYVDNYATISKFSPDLSNLLASTYINGTGYDQGGVIHVDADDNVFQGGITLDAIYVDNFYYPTTSDAYSRSFASDYEGVLVKLDNDLSSSVDYLEIYAHEILDQEDFQNSESVFPTDFTTGGDENWTAYGSYFDKENIIEDDFYSSSYSYGASPTTVFIDENTGYLFFVWYDGTRKLSYKKTLDGGETWGEPVVIDSTLTGWTNLSVWYDGWSPDVTGGLIYIAAADYNTDDIYYTHLDTTDDSLKGDVIAALEGSNFSYFSNSAPAITKNSQGNIFIAGNFSTYVSATGGGAAKSEDNGETWTVYDTNWSANTTDQFQLVSLSDGDIMALKADTANNEIVYQLYDEDIDSWAGSWTTIASLTDYTSLDQWFSATLEKSTGDVYLTFSNYGNNASNDIEFWVFDEESGTRTWSQKTNVVEDDLDALMPTVIYDEAQEKIYVAYRDNLGEELYFKTSIDEGATWSEFSGNLSFLNDSHYALRGSFMAENIPYLISYKRYDDRILGNNLSNIPTTPEYWSMKSGDIIDSQSTYLKTTYNFPTTGELKFRWRSRNEGSGYDYGIFCIDSVDEASCTRDSARSINEGSSNWKNEGFQVEAGEHDFYWKYIKDSSGDNYEDSIWVDDVQFLQPVSEKDLEPGTSTMIGVKAIDVNGLPWEGYFGEQQITFSGASDTSGTPTATDKNNTEVAFGDPVTLDFVKGSAFSDMALYTPETTTIHVTDSSFDSEPGYGLIVNVTGDSGSPTLSPTNSTISISPISPAIGEEVTITITSYDTEGDPYTTGGETVTVSIAGANPTTPTVTDNGDGTYTATYTPTIAGADQITATIDSTAVGGDQDGTSDGTFNLTVTESGGDESEDDSTPTTTEEEEDEEYLELDKGKNGKLTFDVKIKKNNELKSDSIKDSEDQSTEIRNISIKTKKDKKIKGKLEIDSEDELPSELTFPEEVANCQPMQINEITADFSSSDVDEAEITYRIPKGWLDKVENGKLLFSLNSKVKEKNKWAKLLTSKLISIKKDDYIYQTSSDELEGWWAVHVCGETTEDSEEELPVTPDLPTIIEIDLDQDGNNEQALDINHNPSDGYENFHDPDGSSTPIIIEDLDNDGQIDHLIDTNGDNLPDIYWDPDDQLTTETPSLDIDNDQQVEQLIDIDGENQYDYYYDSAENSLETIDTLQSEDVDNDNQTEHLITISDTTNEEFFDPDGSSTVITETDSGYLIDTDQDQQPDVYWDPNQNSLTPTQPLDIDNDGTTELIFGVTTENNQEQGFYYDPDDQQIKSFQSEIKTPENFLTAISQATQRIITQNPTATNTLVASGLVASLLPLLTQLNNTSSFWLIFKEILTRIFGIFGWRRRKQKDWGVVYDVNTGAPLPFTQIQVIDKKSGKVQETKITDKHGAYYFLVNPGTYFLKYTKKGYQAVTTKQDNLKTFYGNSYLGGEIQKDQLAKIYYDIPLTQTQGSQKLTQQKTFATLTTIIFWSGLIINLLVVWFNPSFLNWLILTAYLFLVFVRHFMFPIKEWGLVLNSNHKPLPFTLLKLIDTTTNQMYARTISDEHGRYMLIGKPGKYSLEASTNGRPLNLKPSSLALNQKQAIKEELRGE